MTIYNLTCLNDQEAKVIANTLLEARLIVCAHRQPIQSSYRWEGTIHNETEVLLTMQSTEAYFDAIVALLNKTHTSPDYVLTMMPVLRTTPGVQEWLHENLVDVNHDSPSL